jgi:glycosyltransferase involved in cell wall biosynthesis
MIQQNNTQQYVLITSMNFPSGGAGATYLNLFCRGLKLNNYSISVLLLKGFAFGNYTYKGPRKNITEEGIPYTYLGFRQRPKNQFFKIIEEFISVFRLSLFLLSLINKRKSINLLIYNNEIQFSIPIFLISKILGIKVSKFVAEKIDKSEFMGSFFRRIKRYGYILNHKYLNKKSDKLIVFSLYLKNEYVMIGYNENNIIVQPNLTDFDYWEQTNQEAKYTLGYSGSPYQKDGLSDLFQAIRILQEMNIHVTLLVIGDTVFGKSLIPALKNECNKLGVSEKIFFTGLVESSLVKKYLSECKILTITRPSSTQTKAGFPTKLGEYFATKKSILATNFGDMDNYFVNGVDIIMAECGNPDSIAQKIKWMLENKEDLELITLKGYEKARQLLEYKISVKRMINSLNM